MPNLFVPPSVARELLEERRRFAAAVENGTYTDRLCEEWDRELQRLDPLLRMRRAREAFVIGTPLLPGHYHLIRDNPGAPPSVTPVRGADGGFCYPPGNLLDKLKSMDLWDAKVAALRKRDQDRARVALAREKERKREDRQEDILERWRAVSRAQVSMSRDQPWSQNHAGRRGVRPKDEGKP